MRVVQSPAQGIAFLGPAGLAGPCDSIDKRTNPILDLEAHRILATIIPITPARIKSFRPRHGQRLLDKAGRGAAPSGPGRVVRPP